MSPRPLVLVVSADDDPQLAQLNEIPHVVGNNLAAFEKAAPEAKAILYWSGSRDLLRSLFLASPRLRWVHSRAAGLDKSLFPELVASDIPVTNGSGVFSQSLGEFALAAVLFFAKDFLRMLRNQRAERWEQFDVEEIALQTAGIVGYGDIGRATARRLHAMGMKVLALKRHLPADPDPCIAEFYPSDKLADMLCRCDYVVVAAPLTAETRHMISDAEFAAMKSSAVVINVGRGPVIDQAAMVRALTAGRIRGAGLDVFEKEPIPAGDPIWKLDNVLLSPHCADNTKDWLNDAMQFFLRQYARFEKGEPLENIVKKHLGY
ncbi:MAG TPA: D-2-hydroxyacid dehydrogenase [Terracidiphilus sp.]|jgi:phosphoglycerate dehydrogenase-like enzyme|nr:D-2-hydroxyacid dehydrogenase [Terracidiphilus sp.]